MMAETAEKKGPFPCAECPASPSEGVPGRRYEGRHCAVWVLKQGGVKYAYPEWYREGLKFGLRLHTGNVSLARLSTEFPSLGKAIKDCVGVNDDGECRALKQEIPNITGQTIQEYFEE